MFRGLFGKRSVWWWWAPNRYLLSHVGPERLALLLQVSHAGVHHLPLLCKAAELMQLVLEVCYALLVLLLFRSCSFQGVCQGSGLRLLELLQLPSVLHLSLLLTAMTRRVNIDATPHCGELLFELCELGVARGELLAEAFRDLVGCVGLCIGLGVQACDGLVCCGKALL